MERKIQIVHFLSPKFGDHKEDNWSQLGPASKEGPVGPGLQIKNMLGEESEILGSVFCGDDYFSEHTQDALNDLVARIWNFQPDLVLAGPAMGDRLYAETCGMVCEAIQERLKVPAVTGMTEDNPALDRFLTKLYIVRTGKDSGETGEALTKMVELGLKLVRFEPIGDPGEEGLFAMPGRGCEIA